MSEQEAIRVVNYATTDGDMSGAARAVATLIAKLWSENNELKQRVAALEAAQYSRRAS